MEEALCQVFDFVGGMTFRSDKGVERVPIRLAKILQGGQLFRGTAIRSLANQAPVSRLKLFLVGGDGVEIAVGRT